MTTCTCGHPEAHHSTSPNTGKLGCEWLVDNMDDVCDCAEFTPADPPEMPIREALALLLELANRRMKALAVSIRYGDPMDVSTQHDTAEHDRLAQVVRAVERWAREAR